MATYRFFNRKKIINNNHLYDQKFIDKGITQLIQYETPKLIYPSISDIQKLDIITHIWTQGDSFEKLSTKYYKSPIYWWILPQYNKKPTEQHFSVGDKIYIPLPLFQILGDLGY
jgi:hypothetical protein